MKFNKYGLIILLILSLVYISEERNKYLCSLSAIPPALAAIVLGGQKKIKKYLIFLDPVDVPVFYLKELFTPSRRSQINELTLQLIMKIQEILRQRCPQYQIDLIRGKPSSVQMDKLKKQDVKLIKLEFYQDNWLNRLKLMLFSISRVKKVIILSNKNNHALKNIL